MHDNMAYLAISVAVLAASAGWMGAAEAQMQQAEDRTGGGGLSGLAELIRGNGVQAGAASAYGLPQPQQPYETWAPAPQSHNDLEQPQGFTVQSGYSGLVVPEAALEGDSNALHKLGGVALGAHLLAHLLPFPFNKIAIILGSKIGLWVLGVATLLLIGGAATTALCAFTPICTISFLGFRALSRETTRGFLTKDRLDAATRFVRDAVAKWTELQKRADEEDAKREARKRKKVARSQRPESAVAESAPAVTNATAPPPDS